MTTTRKEDIMKISLILTSLIVFLAAVGATQILPTTKERTYALNGAATLTR